MNKKKDVDSEEALSWRELKQDDTDSYGQSWVMIWERIYLSSTE